MQRRECRKQWVAARYGTLSRARALSFNRIGLVASFSSPRMVCIYCLKLDLCAFSIYSALLAYTLLSWVVFCQGLLVGMLSYLSSLVRIGLQFLQLKRNTDTLCSTMNRYAAKLKHGRTRLADDNPSGCLKTATTIDNTESVHQNGRRIKVGGITETLDICTPTEQFSEYIVPFPLFMGIFARWVTKSRFLVNL